MEPLRSWTLGGPEAELSPEQVNLLSEKIVDCENYFDSDDPEML